MQALTLEDVEGRGHAVHSQDRYRGHGVRSVPRYCEELNRLNRFPLIVIEAARGYGVIYGDTDSTFVWLRRARDEADAARIGRALVEHVNAYWTRHLQETFGLKSALKLQFETHFERFLISIIRGTEEGSKKRYAGLTECADGSKEIIYKGLETVRTDWSPLAQRFQKELYLFARVQGRALRGLRARLRAAHAARRARRTADLSQAPALHARRLSAQCAAACARSANRRRIQRNAKQGRSLQYQNGVWTAM